MILFLEIQMKQADLQGGEAYLVARVMAEDI